MNSHDPLDALDALVMAVRGTHNGRYILEGKVPVPCEDLLEWGRWIEEHRTERIVRQEDIGPYWVSTVFLGLDHSWRPDDLPELFETMVFRYEGDHRSSVDDAPMLRSPTWELALEAHAEACVWAREQLD